MENYIEFLREKVFQVDRWPHYELLLEELALIAEPPAKRILSMERTILYGKSVFAPIFRDHDYVICEVSPESAYTRPGYNEVMSEPVPKWGLPFSFTDSRQYDWVLIPNALHHVATSMQDSLIAFAHSKLKPGGGLYIYEQLIEDYHQIPDDYVRYTPSGLMDLLKKHGFRSPESREAGGIFASAYYCLDTALEYITDKDDHQFLKVFMDHIKHWDARYPTNTEREHTRCPKAFSVTAMK